MTSKEMHLEIMRLQGELNAACVCLSVICEGLASMKGIPVREEALQQLEQFNTRSHNQGQMSDAWREGFERFNKRLAAFMRLPG